MSKIKVNELEAKNENSNIKLTPVGTGVVEVKGSGGNDGILELKTLSGNNSVKLKSPPHSAGQSYTLTLPDNNVEAGKFLKVKSKTGSGNTATGQLECATLNPVDLTQLNASNLSSGTLPSNVLPTTFNATSGAGLKLESHTQVTSGNIYNIQFLGLLDNAEYKLIFKKLRFASYSSVEIKIELLNSTYQPNISIAKTYTNHYANVIRHNAGQSFTFSPELSVYQKNFTGVFDFNTRADFSWASFMATAPGQEECGAYGYFGPRNNYGNISSARIYGIRFSHNSGTAITDADVLLYRFVES